MTLLPRFITRVGAVLVTVAVLAGCGDGSGQFDDRVAAVRDAIEAGDRETAERLLDEIAFQAGASVDDGSLSKDEAREVVELVDSSRALLDDVIATTTTSTTTTTTTTTTPEKDDEDDDKGDKGKKKGHDKDEDEEDDD